MAVSGFGRDTSCTSSLRPGVRVTGVRLVAEAAYRRLTTPRGMLRGGEDEANYGLDLLDMIGAVASQSNTTALGGRIRNELLKDERIETVDVTVVLERIGPSTELHIEIEAETREGPFSLAIVVDDVSVQLLDISVEA